MSPDAFAPITRAIQPRQTGTASSSLTTNPSTPTPTLVSHAAFSTLTATNEELGSNLCTAALPAGGVIPINNTFTLYLEESVSFVAQCGNHTIFDTGNTACGNSTVLGTDPFYASISPQIYALATATVISYVLVILILITPRTFYVGGPGGGGGTGPGGSGAGFRTLFPGASARHSSVIGIGKRPLLQKIAAVTVAVSLTIATADTFRVAEEQYNSGYLDSQKLVNIVVNSLEIRIVRVISDTFLWLAQVQTLIRLFPRHKEKVTIKWLGFGLVLCDTVFSILENFVSQSRGNRPGTFTDAIPALSYLFELSIGLIYASCVLYYSLSKRRFAFWHSKMRNVCLVALISIIAVLIPVVFFITDLAQPDIATWGEYIHWVGAAAASVVVWEWVERIEALERDEKKDGILGREIFDGDEMLEATSSEEGYDHGQSQYRPGEKMTKKSVFWKNVRDLNIDIPPKFPLRRRRRKAHGQAEPDNVRGTMDDHPMKSASHQITRPPQAVTPISRSDTNSATSTVYAVRYHDPFSPSPAIPEETPAELRRQSHTIDAPPATSDESTLTNSTTTTTAATMGLPKSSPTGSTHGTGTTGRQIWQTVANPFKRKRTEPPAEVAAQIAESNTRRSPVDARISLRNRFHAFSMAHKGKPGHRSVRDKTPPAVTFIPAQPRATRTLMQQGSVGGEAEVSTSSNRHVDPDDSSTSNINSPDLAALSITVIPPPVRGGRTWSPDDMVNNGPQSHSPGQHGTTEGPHSAQELSNMTSDTSDSLRTESQRDLPTISESPGRSPDGPVVDPGRPSALTRPRDLRSATMTSISDRLGSTSPPAMSGSPATRSGTTDSPIPRTMSTSANDVRRVVK